MHGCVDRSSPTSSNRSGFGTCVQEVLTFAFFTSLAEDKFRAGSSKYHEGNGPFKISFLTGF